jgi:hypothetical protein
MTAAQLAVRAEPATGQSFQGWLSEELSLRGTGGNMSRFALTHLNLDSIDPNSLLLLSLIAPRYSVTDPEAVFRLKEPQLLNWANNLHALSTVAGMIIPGIRELTEPEQRNLRHVYRKLYRKA